MSKVGVKSMGIKCPIIREGDNLVDVVVDSVLDATAIHDSDATNKTTYDLHDNDVIGVTESVVARSAGLYVSVDEIAEDVKKKFGEDATILVDSPIYSRNRFSMILKGIARAAKKVIIMMPEFDEVGNPSGVNPFTGVDIKEYYKEICNAENCEFGTVVPDSFDGTLYCGLHDYESRKREALNVSPKFFTLADICSDKNPDFGLLGTNKSTEEKLKLFPTKEIAEKTAYAIQEKLFAKTGKRIEVIIYGDGCFHSPSLSGSTDGSSIWEFADPVTVPGYTHGILDGKPNEIKIKAFADDKFKDLSGDELDNAVKSEIKAKESSLVGNMNSQGTTPRRYTDLLASLCDLTSGSGDKGTPVVLVQNYFNNYSE